MPQSDLDLAVLCWSCYNATEVFDKIIDIDGVWVGVKNYDDCSVVAFRGSTTILDWLRDFQGFMIDDCELGGVEVGFRSGIRDVLANVAPIIKTPLYITGHSLGSARALIYAGLVKLSGVPIEAVVTFGPPRPGGQKLKDILSSVPIRCYKNETDPVTDVPFDIPIIEPYLQPRDLIQVNVAPESNDPWFDIAPHHIELYVHAMKGLVNGQVPSIS